MLGWDQMKVEPVLTTPINEAKISCRDLHPTLSQQQILPLALEPLQELDAGFFFSLGLGAMPLRNS